MKISLLKTSLVSIKVVFSLLPLLVGFLTTSAMANYQLHPESPYSKYQTNRIEFIQTLEERFDADDNSNRWKKIVEQNSEDLLLQTYYASSLSLVGRDSWLPWKKIQYVEQAIAIFEHSLDKLNASQSIQEKMKQQIGFDTFVDFEIKNLQSSTYLSLPKAIFSTHIQGRELLLEVINDNRFQKTPLGFQVQVITRLAKHYLEEGGPKEWKKQSVVQLQRILPQLQQDDNNKDSRYYQKAKQMLSQLQ